MVLLDVVHLVVVHENAVVLYLLGIKLYKLQSSVGEETFLFDFASFFHDYLYFYGGFLVVGGGRYPPDGMGFAGFRCGTVGDGHHHVRASRLTDTFLAGHSACSFLLFPFSLFPCLFIVPSGYFPCCWWVPMWR